MSSELESSAPIAKVASGSVSAPAAPGGTVGAGDLKLSIVIPTFNEIANIRELLTRLEDCLAEVAWEVIFVDDDSPDGTAAAVRDIARRDPRIRCLQRIGRRGLSSACIEGMMAAAAPYIAVMDADLQHDERLLPRMLQCLQNEDLDIVVGSRYVAGGSTGQWDQSRLSISRFASKMSRLVLKAELADPMSGFFAVRREAMQAAVHRLSGIGFKILLDLFASSPKPLRFRELPYEFRTRHAGESKLDSQVAWEYLMMLADKLIGHVVPVRFVAFTLVGGLGVAIHLAVLTTLFRGFNQDFIHSQVAATLVAMTGNFLLNNFLTYRDKRLRGWAMLRGWISFSLACSVGALANVGVAAYLFTQNGYWILSALAGVLVGAVWNYAVTAVYTWKK